jgi:Mn2+/Fe2+ NRAMP family transporter
MNHEYKCILNAMIFAVALNLILPVLVGYLPLDKSNEYMKMLAHHKMTPVSSSVIVAVITGLAVYLGYLFKPVEKIA